MKVFSLRNFYREEAPVELKLKRFEDVYVIQVLGEMDLYNAGSLKELVQKMLEKNIHCLVIDMELCEYIDSTGVGTLLGIYNQVKQRKIAFSLSGVKGTVLKVLTLTKLNEFFPLASTLQKAVVQVKKQTTSKG